MSKRLPKKDDYVAAIRASVETHSYYLEKMAPRQKELIDHYNRELSCQYQTSQGASWLTSVVNQFFSRKPAVVITPSAQNPKLNAGVAQALANGFLNDQGKTLNDWYEMALLYPKSFLYLQTADKNVSPHRATLRILPHDSVIIDYDAQEWEEAKFVAVVLSTPVDQVKAMDGVPANLVVGRTPSARETIRAWQRTTSETESEVLESHKVVEVVEYWDFQNAARVIYIDGAYFTDKQTRVISVKPVPESRKRNGRILCPIIPLYFDKRAASRKDGRPWNAIIGKAMFDAVHDQTMVKNQVSNVLLARTATQKDVTLINTEANAFRPEDRNGVPVNTVVSRIANATDGSIIAVPGSVMPGDIFTVPFTPVSPDYYNILNKMEKDIDEATPSASFTKGVATNATATEVSQLAVYTQAQASRLQGLRDHAIRNIVETYLALYCSEMRSDKDIIRVGPDIVTFSYRDIDGIFEIIASDGADTPVAKAQKQQNFMGALPVLQGLGVEPDILLDQMLTLFDMGDLKAAIEKKRKAVASVQEQTQELAAQDPAMLQQLMGAAGVPEDAAAQQVLPPDTE